VISFNRGAAPELIIEGKTGFLVDTLDEMVETIPKIAHIDRKEARRHIEEHFSASAMARNYERLYQQIRREKPLEATVNA
jgi:glycosyltransferase involved in cell wall biosynthesis